MKSGIQILYFADQWDDKWRRRQQIAVRLAQQPKVDELLYIELPLSFTSFIKYIFARADNEAKARWKRVLKQGCRLRVNEKLLLITPLCPLPLFRAGFLSTWNEKQYQFSVRRLVPKDLVSGVRPIQANLLWVSHPFGAWAVNDFGQVNVVYDCSERFEEFSEWQGISGRIKVYDESLIKRADLIFVQTEGHRKEKAKDNAHTYLVENGVEFDKYEKKPTINNRSKYKAPTVGFVGSMNSRSDWGMLYKLARKRVDWSFLLAGNIGVEEKTMLRGLSNVQLVGELTYDSVPAFLSSLEVCLLLYKDLTVLGSPQKLFDYLAAGKPVVSTPIAGMTGYQDYVYLAKDAREFEEAIAKALKEDSPALAEKRRAKAKECSWDSRMKEILGHLQGVLS